MRVDNVYLAGIGSFFPEAVDTHVAVARGWYEAADQERTGMLSATVADALPAPDMAVWAARTALQRSGAEAAEIDALFHSSVHYQGPDVWSAHHYILRHTLNTPIPALEVRQGCNGMLAAMELASGYLESVPERTSVLLTSGENYSNPNVDRWRCSRMFVLGDGGASIVLSKRSGFARLAAVGSVSNPRMEEMHRGGEELVPPGITVGRKLDLEARMSYWREAWAKGVTPPVGHMGDVVTAAVGNVLKDAGLSLSDIKRVAHVNFGSEALRQMFLEPIDIGLERGSWEFGRRVGHVGAVDSPAALEHLWISGDVAPGDYVLMLGATPGMEAGCAIVEILKHP